MHGFFFFEKKLNYYFVKEWEFIDGGIAKSSRYMHTLISNRLEPATIYEYKVLTVDAEGKLHSSDIFQIHTPDLLSSSPFKFLATGDIVSISLPLFFLLLRGLISLIFFFYLKKKGCCERGIYAII